jgi:threonine dehydrogenase-like Zn-dependent dehydrogenase
MEMKTMKASVLVGPGKQKVMEMPNPEITADQVLIKVKACGVCASEMMPWSAGQDEKNRLILGHEGIGIIKEAGINVVGFQKGDRVTGLFHNAFAEYTVADYKSIIKVPEGLEDVLAIGEPLSCLMSGANRTLVSLGDTAAIVGLGFMGLGMLQLMKLKGAGNLIAIDVRQESLDNALRFGADIVYSPDQVPSKYKVLQWNEIGQGVDVSVEASGSQLALDLASEMVAAHGVLSIVGYHQSNQGNRNVRMDFWNWKAITVVNAHERRTHVHLKGMEAVLGLIQAGKFNMKDMITNIFSLDEVDKGYEAIKNKPDGFIKSVIKIG